MGDSHQHWNNQNALLHIQAGHIEKFYANDADLVVSIVPCAAHRLDYYNNQFFKLQRGQLINYILSQMSQQEADVKLATKWNYNSKFNEAVPRWIMREWCSFWINDVLEASYNTQRYQELYSVAQFTTQDIFTNYIELLVETISKLGLTITVNLDTIHKQHVKFLSAQKFHNSQKQCEQYVHDVLVGNNNQIILNSIFDEAYIQHLLRCNNLEIQCNSLDIFSTTTQHLKNLTYEAMHNTDPG
tara:strand:- start:91 stop:819 length:729 start_codon:yes stop_codon:yes gene_type:complete